MDKVAQIGCIACRVIGIHTPEVSIHHIEGRTKPDAHFLTLPLCYGHHQGGLDYGEWVSVHPWKKRFEDTFGTQRELLELCRELVKGMEHGS